MKLLTQQVVERLEPVAGDKRMFWGRQFAWNGSDWKPTKATPASEPDQKPAQRQSDSDVTVLAKYRLKFTGPGHEKVAQAVERGIDRSADLCKINPPICKGNLGITRDKMPQFRSDVVRDSFLDSLKKRGVRVTQGKVHVGRLKASQEEIQAKKTVEMAGRYLDGNFPNIKNAIVISRDGYIVDGHHRWAALLTVGPDQEMNVIRVGMPIKALLEMANDHPGVEKSRLSDPGRARTEALSARTVVMEKLSVDVSRKLRSGNQIRARTRRAVVMRKEPNWPMHAFEPFDGPAEIVGKYVKDDVIPGSWPAAPNAKSDFRPHGGGAGFSAFRLQYKGMNVLVPKEDADEVVTARAARVERYVPLGRVLDNPMPLGELDTRFGFGFANTTQPPSATRGVGISPSASPADPVAGRFQVYAKAGKMKRRKPGYKPTRAGAGSMVGTVARDRY